MDHAAFGRLEAYMHTQMQDSAHDREHVYRVLYTALDIAANEPGADADVLIAADCTAFAYANLHADFLRGRVTLIGCPKLDGVDYAEKLAQVFLQNEIRSVTVLRMEVPCCGGLAAAVERALAAAGRGIPLTVRIVGIDGTLR